MQRKLIFFGELSVVVDDEFYLSTRFGVYAALNAMAGNFGHLVALRHGAIALVPLGEAAKGQRLVPLDSDFLRVGRSVGISFGDEE